MRRERRRLQARHIWEKIQPNWPLIEKRVWTKHATGLPYQALYRRLFLQEYTEEQSTFYSLKNLQHLEQALPSPSDGRHACSRRCQLALDLTVRGTGYHHPPPHSPGDCNVVRVVSFFVSSLLLFGKKLFQ